MSKKDKFDIFIQIVKVVLMIVGLIIFLYYVRGISKISS